MRIATIHGLCHRVLAPRAELVGLRSGYGLLNEPEQHLLLCRELDTVLGPNRDMLSRRGWREGVHGAAEAARYFDRICEELVEPVSLAQSERPFAAAVGRSCIRYRALLRERNLVDFAHLPAWAERVLRQDEIAAQAAGAIRHLLVDEFQDTSIFAGLVATLKIDATSNPSSWSRVMMPFLRSSLTLLQVARRGYPMRSKKTWCPWRPSFRPLI